METERKPNALERCFIILVEVPSLITFVLRIFMPLILTELAHGFISSQLFSEMSKFLQRFPSEDNIATDMAANIASWIYLAAFCLLKLTLLSIVCFDLLFLLTAFLTISLALVTGAKGERVKKLKEMVQRGFSLVNSKGPLVNFANAALMSFVGYVVMALWITLGAVYAVPSDVFFAVMDVVEFTAVLMKRLEFSAVWNVGAVISKEKNGFEALSIWKVYYGEGRWLSEVATWLHFLWSFNLGSSSLRFGASHEYTGFTGRKSSAFSAVICVMLHMALVRYKVI